MPQQCTNSFKNQSNYRCTLCNYVDNAYNQPLFLLVDQEHKTCVLGFLSVMTCLFLIVRVVSQQPQLTEATSYMQQPSCTSIKLDKVSAAPVCSPEPSLLVVPVDTRKRSLCMREDWRSRNLLLELQTYSELPVMRGWMAGHVTALINYSTYTNGFECVITIKMCQFYISGKPDQNILF